MFFSKKEAPGVDLSKIAFLLVTLISIVVILIYTKDYVIPFIVAMLIWFLIHETREYLERIPIVKRKCPVWVQSTISFFLINIVLFLVANMLYINMASLSENLEAYEASFGEALAELSSVTGIDVSSQVEEYSAHTDFTEMISTLINTITSLFGDGFIILLYVIFLLIEETVFENKLNAFYSSDEKRERASKLLYKMDQNIGQYLRLKTFVSLITGVLSYLVLLIFGIDSPLFWAMLIFVLNYIPTVGSLIATLFPAFFAVLQFGELMPFLYIMGSVGIIQVVVGNIVEPKLMGNSLNMSSLVVVLSLTIWGAIWGVMGMILSVPITVVMIIVFEEIPSLRFIAIALSESGELSKDKEAKETEPTT